MGPTGKGSGDRLGDGHLYPGDIAVLHAAAVLAAGATATRKRPRPWPRAFFIVGQRRDLKERGAERR